MEKFNTDDLSQTSYMDIKMQPGQMGAVLLKRKRTLFRASRANELPTKQWLKKIINNLSEGKSEEWSGCYFHLGPSDNDNYSPTANEVKGYGADYVDEDTGEGEYLLDQREIVEEFWVITNLNRKHGAAAVDGDTKALALKDFVKTHGLGLVNNTDENLSKISNTLKEAFSKNNGKFLTVLDRLGYGYLGPHTEDEGDELILGPHTLDKIGPKKISKVYALGFGKQDELPEDFLKNTDFKTSRDDRDKLRFISQYGKQKSNDTKSQDLEMKMKRNNQYLTLMAKMSPVQTLEAVTEMIEIATDSPCEVATIIRFKTLGGEHASSLLAGVVAGGMMDPLAEAWISLLHLLYEEKHLSGNEIISALLPHKEQDRVKSLAHAIAGAAWSSQAATKLCTLLTEVANSDEQLLKLIIERLSIKQSCYGFQQIKLNTNADFYKRAKLADKFNPNATAKAQLKDNHLIPSHRQLYNMTVSGTQAAGINRKTSFKDLRDKICNEITPQVQASYDEMKKKMAELERAKRSAREERDKTYAREKGEKQLASNNMTASLAAYSAKQELYNQSRRERYSVWDQSQASTSQEEDTTWPAYTTNTSDTPKTDDNKSSRDEYGYSGTASSSSHNEDSKSVLQVSAAVEVKYRYKVGCPCYECVNML